MSRIIKYQETPVPYYGKLTLSAGVITDVTRLAGVEGDGLEIGAGAGVWPAATNLEPYGRGITNKEASGTGIAISATTENPLFGDGHMRITATGNSASASVRHPAASAVAVSAATVYTVGAWYKKVSGSFSSTGILFINWLDAGRAYLSTSSSVSIAGAGTDWTRYAVTVTSHASAAYADVYWVSLGASQTVTIDVTGMSLYASAIDMPYIETDGGTAARVAGSIEGVPASVLDETQMWVCARVRVDSTPTGSGRIFSFGDALNNRLELLISNTNQRAYVQRNAGGLGGALSSGSGTIAVGDTATYFAGFTSTQIHAANNGAVLTSIANTAIPTLASAAASLGKQNYASSGYPGASLIWLAIGLGTPTDALSATLHAFGNKDPLPHQFPPGADLRFLTSFNGDGTAYRYK